MVCASALSVYAVGVGVIWSALSVPQPVTLQPVHESQFAQVCGIPTCIYNNVILSKTYPFLFSRLYIVTQSNPDLLYPIEMALKRVLC